MEFIYHLGYVKNEAINNKYVFDGKEVKGIDNDIDALRLYLTLTCIDIFASTQVYKTFDQWLLLNCDDFLSDMGIKEYITKKAAEYNNSYGISSNFEKAFINSSEELKTNLMSNLTVHETDKKTNDLQSIIRFLKSVRNKYTHEGKRVYYFSSSAAAISAVVIGVRLKEVNGEKTIENRSSKLVINSGFDLISVLKEVAIEQCKRAFKFTS